MRQTRLKESSEYRRVREELRQSELELMLQRERVAELRRALPLDTIVDDYVFVEGPADLSAGDAPERETRLSELFTGDGRALIVYHLMYGKAQTSPCPMCTMWIDGFDAIDPHVTQNVDLVIAAAAELGPLRYHARARGWHNLRLLSSAGNSFKYDLGSEDEHGGQLGHVSVFTRERDGTLHHFYTGTAQHDETHYRGLDLLTPVWHLLDLTPDGRPDWHPALS